MSTVGEQVVHGTFEAAAETGFVAREQRERPRLVGKRGERRGETGTFVEVLPSLVQVRRLPVHLDVEQSGFDGPGTAEAPAGGGDFGDEFALVFGCRLKCLRT